jgi:hypothetical protein
MPVRTNRKIAQSTRPDAVRRGARGSTANVPFENVQRTSAEAICHFGTAPCLFGANVDRLTKATLWVAFLVLASYFVWFYVDCATDDTCQIVCRSGGRGGCYVHRTPAQKSP